VKAVVDDDSEGTDEIEAISTEVNDAIAEKDTLRLGKYFERELDEIHTPRGSSYWSESSEGTAEKDRREREDAELRAALAIKATEALAAEGIRVTRVTETEDRDGYRIVARDQQRRAYEARITYERAILDAECLGPVGLIDRMTAWVVEGIRGERDRYFRRAGLS
jgi:hypothetical protein